MENIKAENFKFYKITNYVIMKNATFLLENISAAVLVEHYK